MAMGLVALLSGPVQAQPEGYVDLIEMPSAVVEAARHGLTLDIVQTGERLVSVGERGHILLSDDWGRNWTQAEVETRAQLNAVTFVDDTHGWAVGEDAVILHTSDGGSTWTRQFDGRDADMQGPLLDVWFRNAREGFAVGVFNKIFKTSDGGETWVDWYDHIDNLDEWHLFAIAGFGDDTIYIASEQGLVFRSTDGGESFAAVQTDHYGSFHGILAGAGADGADKILLSGVGGIVYVTSDGTQTWNKLDTGTEAGLSGGIWLPDGSVAVVGYGGMLLHIDTDLRRVEKYPQENGLPLSSVISLDAGGQLVLTGFGGPQLIEAPWRAQ